MNKMAKHKKSVCWMTSRTRRRLAIDAVSVCTPDEIFPATWRSFYWTSAWLYRLHKL